MAWSFALLAVLIGLDQALKYWTVSHLALGESAQLIPGALQLTRLHNYGAAWSSLSGKTAVLLVITAALMIAVAWLLIKKIVRHPLGITAARQLAGARRPHKKIVPEPRGVTAGLFILGGGLGNMIDRVWHGYVVDMLDISPLLEYPVFNLADCFVVVGAVLGAVYYLWFYDKYDKKERGHGRKDPDSHN